MKKLISLLALLLALGMLAACATPVAAPEPTASPDSTVTLPPAAETPEAETPAADGPTMKDGIYTAQATGFSLYEPVTVTVEISEGKIASVAIGDNAETNGMPQAVEANMIPDIIENQSLAVDVTTGATATSVAVRTAVQSCCEQAGGDKASLYGEVAKDTTPKNYEVDVLVIGMGGSGTAAAISAAESGANVLAIDKAGKWGGTSVVAGGSMGVNVPSQVAAEIPDWEDAWTGEVRTKKAGELLVDADKLYEDWLAYTTADGVQEAKPEIVRKIIDGSGEMIDWLISYGFEFTPALGFIGNQYSIYCDYVGNKANTEGYFAAAYDKYVNELGGNYLLNTAGTELIYEDGVVTGAKALTQDGAEVTIRAKSVVLATGGFPGSSDMKTEYIRGDWKVYGMMQNTGDGIQMALDAGAATYNIDMAPMAHFVGPAQITRSFDHADNDIPYGLVCTGECLAVNSNGARTLNEELLPFEGYTIGARFYAVYSKEQIDILRTQGLSQDAAGRYLSQGGIAANTPLANIDTVLADCIERGFVYKASTLDELASAIGGDMDASALKASVQSYVDSANGADDPLGKSPAMFERLGAPAMQSEYYIAVTGAPYIYMTCAGVDVDADMRVLRQDGSAIQGLYAVGADSMGVLFTNKKGYTNYGGVSMGYVFTSGKIAGEKAAAAAK